MPEGDSLVRLAHRLRQVMQDQILEATDFRTPRLATTDLAGWQITQVIPTAKYISMVVQAPAETDSAATELIVLSHLGMDGSWRIDTRPTHTTRCILHFDTHRVVGSSLASLEVLAPEQARAALAFLGPDLLSPDWHQPETARKLFAEVLTKIRQAPDQPIGTALLDQRLVSGLGNIYRCEVLALARLSPFVRVSTLSDAQLTGLLYLGRELMLLNVPPRSTSHARRATVDVRPDPEAVFGVRIATPQEQARSDADRSQRRGKHPAYWVYNRQREGCLRCGGPVYRDMLGVGDDRERRIFWCPTCQAPNE